MLTQLKQTKSAIWKIALSLPVIALLIFMYSCDTNESEALEPTAEFSADATIEDILAAYKAKYPDIAIEAVHITKEPGGESGARLTIKNVNDAGDKRKIEDLISQKATKYLLKQKRSGDLTTATAPAQGSREIFQVVEHQPQPSGGMGALYKYIGENLVYASEARAKGIEGKVFVQFIVNKDGSISDVQVLKGLGYGLDEEAVRVIKNMPAWQPGKQKDQPVNVRMSIPIVFKLN